MKIRTRSIMSNLLLIFGFFVICAAIYPGGFFYKYQGFRIIAVFLSIYLAYWSNKISSLKEYSVVPNSAITLNYILQFFMLIILALIAVTYFFGSQKVDSAQGVSLALLCMICVAVTGILARIIVYYRDKIVINANASG